MSHPKKKSREYLDVNVPRRLEPFMQELLNNKEILAKLEFDKFSRTLSGLGNWIIRQFLIDNTSYRFDHINMKENHITIKDRKLRRVVDVWVKDKDKLWCELDDSNDCDHVHATLEIEEVRDILQKKGWELPER
jgi:hypothetical protein